MVGRDTRRKFGVAAMHLGSKDRAVARAKPIGPKLAGGAFALEEDDEKTLHPGAEAASVEASFLD